MKAYHEYLELHSYFAQGEEPRLGRADFEAADGEFRELVSRLGQLAKEERTRLGVLKALLFRDKP